MHYTVVYTRLQCTHYCVILCDTFSRVPRRRVRRGCAAHVARGAWRAQGPSPQVEARGLRTRTSHQGQLHSSDSAGIEKKRRRREAIGRAYCLP
eukprot:scaffold1760_cov109-Isochrysis_galbana.AAC.8